MSLTLFLLQTIIVSLSGVMAPGPVTAVTLGRGSTNPHAGALIAIGHGIIEMPLIALLVFGLGSMVTVDWAKGAIAVAGGLFLLWMGIDLLKNARTAAISSVKDNRAPVTLGIVLSAGNPYFLFWWAIVGITLISSARAFGAMGIVVFAVVHWLCDFGWLYLLSFLSFRGSQFFGRVFQRILFAACGILLCVFSAKFVIDGIGTLAGIFAH
jgi:threonine/homoserine/homoserine lactone efflux protein